jgi:LuxR family maltose regulon positive regulatory protein
MDLDIPITRTRIIVPRVRGDFLSRPRLLEILDGLIDKKLILVSAPAGYGKTSLLVDFVNHLEIPACWYAIDTLDQDPYRFISYIIASLHQRFPTFGHSSFEALKSTTQVKPDLDYLVSVIVNDAYDHINEHFVIVLDDYHLVDQSEQVNHFISRFVQDMDENCHVIFASRTLLSLPDLPLMVARSQVGGLSFEELAFNLSEIKNLYKQLFQSELNDDEAVQLISQTEGWITGVLLTAKNPSREVDLISLSRRTAGIGLNEYFQQVLIQNPLPVQEFLLRSSLLEEFDASLCQEVIGIALGVQDIDWESLISSTLRNNLFVLPIGDEGNWIRYHHLFRDFLQSTMIRERPQEAEKIWQQLAQLNERKGEWEEAYAIYRRLNRTNELVTLIESAGPSLTVGGRLSTLAEWLDELPIELISRHPALVSLQGNIAVMQGDMKQGILLFNQALASMKLPEDREAMVRTLARRSAAYRMMADHTSAMEDGKKIISLVEGDLSLRNFQADAMRSIGVSLYQQGKASEALPWLLESIEIYKSFKNKKDEAVVNLEAGVIHQTLGNYREAEKLYEDALTFWRETHNSVWQANLLNNLGVLQHLMGDYEVAASTLDKALQHARITGYQRLEAFALAGIGDIYRDLDAPEEAGVVYQQALDIARRIEDQYLFLYLQIAQAVVLSLNQHANTALSNLVEIEQTAQDRNAPFEAALCQYERGAIFITQKKYHQAILLLNECIKVFEDGGHKVQIDCTRFLLMVAQVYLGDYNQAEKILTEIMRSTNLSPLIWLSSRFSDALEIFKKNTTQKSSVDRLLELVLDFKERLPSLRRRLRQKSTSVPFAPAKYNIRALGRMQVKVNGKVIGNSAWQTQNARDLFFLLLTHPEGLTKETIGLIFWPDASSEDVRFRFKNTVYRVRKAAGKETITLHDDYYQFNYNLDYDYDVEDFLKEIEDAQNSSTPEVKIEHLRNAIQQYKGAYLPELEETWVIPEREHLQQLYNDAAIQLAELYTQQGQYQSALDECTRILAEDGSLEAAHRIAMRVHAAMGNSALVARQYEKCVQFLANEIGVPPSSQTQALYQTLIK